MLDEESAARAERQTVDVRALIGAARRTVRGAARPRRRIPNRPRAHDAGGRDVLIEERRRHRQHARHVVEAIGFVVLGQEGAGVDAQRRAVPRWRAAYSARLSRCSATRPGFGLRRGGLVERALQPRHEPVQRPPDPAGARRAAASCRRAACARLSPRRPRRRPDARGPCVSNVRSAVLARWLWHVTQYWSRSARSGDLRSARPARLPAARRQPQRASHDQRRARRDRRETHTNSSASVRGLRVDRRGSYDATQLAHVQPHAAIGRGHEQVRIRPTSRRTLWSRRRRSCLRAHALLHHLRRTDPSSRRACRAAPAGRRASESARCRARCASRRSPGRAGSCSPSTSPPSQPPVV